MKLKAKILNTATAMSLVIINTPVAKIFADGEEADTALTGIAADVSGAITSVIATIRGIAVPIASLALVIIGVSMVISDDASTKQKCKNWLISIAIGMAVIVLAEPIAKWMQGIAG